MYAIQFPTVKYDANMVPSLVAFDPSSRMPCPRRWVTATRSHAPI